MFDESAHSWVPIGPQVKHRMSARTGAAAPPLYDVIQLVIYMLMHGAQEGDLVQCWRDKSATSQRQVSTARCQQGQVSAARQRHIGGFLRL